MTPEEEVVLAPATEEVVEEVAEAEEVAESYAGDAEEATVEEAAE